MDYISDTVFVIDSDTCVGPLMTLVVANCFAN